jgi:type II secretion system protein N
MLYGTYLLFMVGLFLYVLFPDEKAKAYIENRISNANPQLSVEIADLGPSLGMALKCSDVTALYNNDPLFNFSRMALSQTLGSLFTAGSIYTFDGDAYQGTLDGKIKLTENDTALTKQIDTNLKNVNLDEVPAIGKLYGIKIVGKLSGKIRSKTTEGVQNTTVLFTVSQGTVQLPPTLPGIETIEFNQIKAVITAANRQLNIKNLALTGPQINGSFSGSIQLREPLGNSKLNLRGKIKPYEEFLADLKEKLPLAGLLNKQPPKGGYTLSITGTIDSPNTAFN